MFFDTSKAKPKQLTPNTVDLTYLRVYKFMSGIDINIFVPCDTSKPIELYTSTGERLDNKELTNEFKSIYDKLSVCLKQLVQNSEQIMSKYAGVYFCGKYNDENNLKLFSCFLITHEDELVGHTMVDMVFDTAVLSEFVSKHNDTVLDPDTFNYDKSNDNTFFVYLDYDTDEIVSITTHFINRE